MILKTYLEVLHKKIAIYLFTFTKEVMIPSKRYNLRIRDCDAVRDITVMHNDPDELSHLGNQCNGRLIYSANIYCKITLFQALYQM